MLNQILKFTLVSSIALFLRKRWKRLSGCALAIVAAVYIHGEYLDYVGALPAGTPDAAQAGEYLLTAFLLKNAVIAAAVLVIVVLEVRASRGKRTAAGRTEDTASSATPQDAPLSSEERQGDGFDFLRKRGKLASRTEQLIRGKPAR